MPFFGKGAELPQAIEVWLESIGSDSELDAYHDDLHERFLHQDTICAASIAVVPWLVHACTRLDTDHRALYCAHVALVEANRLAYGVGSTEPGGDELLESLMPDYRAAIERARVMADGLAERHPVEAAAVGLLALRPALHGDATLAWAQWGEAWRESPAGSAAGPDEPS